MTESGWTFDTMLLHLKGQLQAQEDLNKQRFTSQETAVNAALAAQEKAVAAALAAAERAVGKQEQASEKRFDGVNAFRQVLTDQTQKFIPRIEAEQLISALREKLEAQAELLSKQATRLDKNEGRSGGLSSSWAILIAIAAIIIPMILVLTR